MKLSSELSNKHKLLLLGSFLVCIVVFFHSAQNPCQFFNKENS